MSEERFEFYSDDYLIGVLDNVTGKTLNHFATIDLLNEQQSTIGEQKIAIDELITDYKKLEGENEQLRKQVKSSETTSDATSNYNAHLESKITTLEKENEQLQKELQRFKKYVFSQDNILCYKCERCIKKDIYVVDCEMKGEVDVHGLCSLFREVKV